MSVATDRRVIKPAADAVARPVRAGEVAVVQLGPLITPRQLRDVITDVELHVAQCRRFLTVETDSLLDGDATTELSLSWLEAGGAHPVSLDWAGVAARHSDAALVLITGVPALARRLQCWATTALWIEPAAAELGDWGDAAVAVSCEVRSVLDGPWIPFATWVLG